jgi:hypothetical protein
MFRGFEFIIGGMVSIYGMLFLGLVLSLAVPYVVLRLRDSRSEKPDPQIGIKSALYFFFSVGILLFLNGLTALVVDLLVNTPAKVPGQGLTYMQRLSLAFMTSGALFALLHLGLVKATTNDRDRAPRRIFAGWRLAIHGIVVIFTTTILLVILFQKDFGGEAMKDARKALLGTLLVWVPSWILHLVLVGVYSMPRYEPSRSSGGVDWER